MLNRAAPDTLEIDTWLWATPNSNRVSILLEELGFAYRVHPVNIRKKEQFAPDIVAMNPYGKIPIVKVRAPGEEQTLLLFESGAILQHFADMTGQLLPQAGPERAETLIWFNLVMTGLAPPMGQAHHWSALAVEPNPSALAHCIGMVERVFHVLEKRLAINRNLGHDYSIADIAAFPWIARSSWALMDLSRFPAIARWHAELAERPAVQRGMNRPEGARLE